MGRVGRVIALALAMVTFVPANAPADEPAEPGLVFAQTSLVVTLRELTKGTRVTVLNRRTRTLRAQFRLGDLGLRSPSPPSGHISTAAAIRIESVSVPGAGERNVLIQAPNLKVAPALYEGALAVYNTETDSVARIAFKLDARTKKREVAAKPAVQKLEDTATRSVPGSAVDEVVTVPLDIRSGPPALHVGMTVGFLGGPDGHIASVKIASKPSRMSSGVADVSMRVSGLDRAGAYAGTIDLAPNDEKIGALELSVSVRDAIWWPALALLLGIILALWRLHWTGAARPGFALERRRAAAAKAFNAAKRRFDHDAKTKPWAGYNAWDAFKEANDDAEAIVRELAGRSFDELDPDVESDADDAIARLEVASAALRSLGKALPDLEAAVKKIDGLDRITALPGPRQPAFAMSAGELLQGRKLDDLEALTETCSAVTVAAALANRWPLLYSDTALAVTRVAPREDSTPDETLAVAAAKRKLVGAWLVINDAPDAGTVAERKLVDHLIAAHMAAAEVAPADAIPAGARAATLGAVPLEIKALLPTFGGLLGELPADPARRIRAIDRLVRRGDLLVVVLAGLLALYSGLQALYFGKAFGTAEDYLAAFLWGLTAAGALDILGQALRTRLSPLV